jgi:nucleoside-diphosphate-sugar epimerase
MGCATLRPMNERASRTIEKGDRVCVTGAAGFIGSHVVQQLLSAGYDVRATVRDAKDDAKTAHLRALAKDSDGTLELVSADLMRPGAFDDAVKDCPYVCHVASSVRLSAPDPQRDIVDVAVHGTDNVLSSVEKAGDAYRVVVTSSIAAIVDETKPHDFLHDETCWNETSTVQQSPYPLSKTLAEKAAYARADALDDDARYGLVTINPTLVLGPVLAKSHGRSSPALIRDLISGKFPLIPNFHFGVVDVRDVAAAHVRGLERADARGRYLLNSEGAWLTDLAATVRRAYPDKKTPKYRMPNLMTYGVALFDKRLSFSFLRRNLGVAHRYDNAKSRRELGIEYRPPAETARDTAKSFVELGIV